MITFKNKETLSAELTAAMQSGEAERIQAAWAAFGDGICAQLREDFEEVQRTQDNTILQQRGYRVLTSEETKWYQKIIDALKSTNPKQAFADIIGDDSEISAMMPSSIIEDVYRNLQETHQLFQTIRFQYVNYLTRWIINDWTKTKAKWGEITDTITQEITSGFKIIEVKQAKLSAYAAIELGMLDLGPVFLDGYIRTCLREALLYGLEDGIINGNGLNAPAGLTMDIHEGVSFSTSTGYPVKSTTSVSDFSPASYGALIAQLSKTEAGNSRRFTKVYLAVNLKTYLTKVIPATRVMTSYGRYESYLDSIFPTEIIICNSVADDKGVLYVPDEYYLFVGAGSSREGVIEYSDHYKFLEDMRYFKIKMYGAGHAYDNTTALYLDLANVKSAALAVQNVDGSTVAVTGEVTTNTPSA